MSMQPKELRSEITRYTDPKSGRIITKLTESGFNYHFYFTENSFTAGDREIIYRHSESPWVEGEPSRLELYAMDLESGIRTQLTDFSSDFSSYSFQTKAVDSSFFLCICDGDLYRYDRESQNLTLLYRTPRDFKITGTTISFDNRYVAITLCEKVELGRKLSGTNYDGFAEQLYAHKRGRIILLTADGREERLVHEDPHWINHIQFAPDTNEYLTYCHEGPWHLVHQRIWLFNTLMREVTPCVRQKADDSIGHEFWTRDGLVFFDNRGRGHDGSITVDKTQAVATEHSLGEVIPIVGFADKSGKILRSLELPFYCNHYHASRDNRFLVGDAVEDLLLIDVSTDTPTAKHLSTHNTSWIAQHTHPHPTFSWSNDKILYASDEGKLGQSQLFLIETEGLLK